MHDVRGAASGRGGSGAVASLVGHSSWVLDADIAPDGRLALSGYVLSMYQPLYFMLIPPSAALRIRPSRYAFILCNAHSMMLMSEIHSGLRRASGAVVLYHSDCRILYSLPYPSCSLCYKHLRALRQRRSLQIQRGGARMCTREDSKHCSYCFGKVRLCMYPYCHVRIHVIGGRLAKRASILLISLG